jgi:uncharacterized membrane protein (DUF485 family)
MQTDLNERIRANPRFQELVRRRGLINGALFWVSMAMYWALILTVAFNPQVLHTPLTPGGVVTIGWPLGAAVVVVPWLLTLVYLHFANQDTATIKEIFKESGL